MLLLDIGIYSPRHAAIPRDEPILLWKFLSVEAANLFGNLGPSLPAS
jgi:hypothetical protein